MNFLVKIIIYAIAVIVTTLLLPGVRVDTLITAVLVAAVLVALNTIVKPVLVILTLPITVFTLGLFIFVINAAIVLLANIIVPGFEVDGFLSALLFSLIVSVLVFFFEKIDKKERRAQRGRDYQKYRA